MERLNAIIESAPSGLLMTDEKGIITLVNKEIERMFGYDRAELLGKPVEMLIPERYRNQHSDFRLGFYRTPQVRAMGSGRDLFGLRKNGTEVPVEIGLTPVDTREGMFVISSVVDISARKAAEERFQIAVEASPNGMLMIDGEGKIVMVNRRVEDMFGYERRELLHQYVEILVPEAFRESHPDYREHFSKNPQTREMGAGRDLYGLHKSGKKIPVEIGLNPIHTDEGVFVLSSIVDITARKEEEERERAHSQELQAALRLKAIGQLASGVAHDFNNILGAVIGHAELSLAEEDKGIIKEDLQGILAAAKRGKIIVDRILSFSRNQGLELRPLSITRQMEETLKLFRVSVPPDIKISLTKEAELPRVMAEATAVEQIILNLLSNAIHAMPDGGHINILVGSYRLVKEDNYDFVDVEPGDYVRIIVKDTGIGMDGETLQHALEPFYSTKATGDGSGLGLSTVYGLLQEMKGGISIKSEPGGGTSIECLIPAVLSAEQKNNGADRTVPRGNQERILYIDDDAALTALSRRMLNSLNYQVTPYTDPVKAIEHFTLSPGDFDCVVVDYSMPQINGIDVIKNMKSVRQDIPFLMISGTIDNYLLDIALEAGAGFVLKKPFVRMELGKSLAKLLNNT